MHHGRPERWLVTEAERLAAFEVIYAHYSARIESEDRLIDQRMQWLLVGQGLLFTALSVALSVPGLAGHDVAVDGASALRTMIPVVGIAVAAMTGLALGAAVRVAVWCIDELGRLSRQQVADDPADPESAQHPLLPADRSIMYPQVLRSRPRRMIWFYAGFAPPLLLPWVFVLTWSYMLVRI